MALLVAVVVGFTLFDGPLRWVVIAAGAAVEIGEAYVMIRLSRARRPAVGPEALVGRYAVTAGQCRPDGQVRIDGEIWAARSPSGAPAGAKVRVVDVEGLVLIVEPAHPDD